jgi:hypothetical protein
LIFLHGISLEMIGKNEKKPQSREGAAALDSIKLEPEIQAEA